MGGNELAKDLIPKCAVVGCGGSNVEARLRDDSKNHDPWIELKPLREDCEAFILMLSYSWVQIVWYTKVELSQRGTQFRVYLALFRLFLYSVDDELSLVLVSSLENF